MDKKYIRHWKSKDSRELFYSLHRDEVAAESVMNSCCVYFVSDNEQIPNPGEYPDFIVRNFYDCGKKKLWKLSDTVFYKYDQKELDILVAKSISLAGDLLDIEKKKKSSRKQAFPRRIIKDAEGNNVFKKSQELVDQIKVSYHFLLKFYLFLCFCLCVHVLLGNPMFYATLMFDD